MQRKPVEEQLHTYFDTISAASEMLNKQLRKGLFSYDQNLNAFFSSDKEREDRLFSQFTDSTKTAELAFPLRNEATLLDEDKQKIRNLHEQHRAVRKAFNDLKRQINLLTEQANAYQSTYEKHDFSNDLNSELESRSKTLDACIKGYKLLIDLAVIRIQEEGKNVLLLMGENLKSESEKRVYRGIRDSFIDMQNELSTDDIIAIIKNEIDTKKRAYTKRIEESIAAEPLYKNDKNKKKKKKPQHKAETALEKAIEMTDEAVSPITTENIPAEPTKLAEPVKYEYKIEEMLYRDRAAQDQESQEQDTKSTEEANNKLALVPLEQIAPELFINQNKASSAKQEPSLWENVKTFFSSLIKTISLAFIEVGNEIINMSSEKSSNQKKNCSTGNAIVRFFSSGGVFNYTDPAAKPTQVDVSKVKTHSPVTPVSENSPSHRATM